MTQYEFKHVRMKHGLAGEFITEVWEQELERLLQEMGDQGWDLKTAHHEAGAMHTHFIFGREKN